MTHGPDLTIEFLSLSAGPSLPGQLLTGAPREKPQVPAAGTLSVPVVVAQDPDGDCGPVTEASTPPPSSPEMGLLEPASGMGGQKGCPLPTHHGSSHDCQEATPKWC